MAPSATAVDAMVKHPVFTAIERRWQLPVYFQLRWKEIVAPLEEVLLSTKLEVNPVKGTFIAVSISRRTLTHHRQPFRVETGISPVGGG